MIEVDALHACADEMLSGLSADDAMRRRILLRAKAVEDLPAVAGEMLSSLQAGPALRHRILVSASRRRSALFAPRPAQPARAMRRFTPVMGMAMALVMMLGIGMYFGANPLPGAVAPEGQTSLTNTYAAGTAVQSGTVPQYRTLFAGEAVNPPLLSINGRYYRLLTSPLSVSASLAGSAFAEVQTFTEEPSLTNTIGVFSNVVSAGSAVYAVNGLSTKTAVLAEVEGALRVFQRVRFAGNGMIGSEMFEDTLGVYGQVAALELSGVGIVADENAANELIYMLSEFAVEHAMESSDGTQALTIYLASGLSLQLEVSEDVLIGCGAWACPEFFDAFRAAMQ